MYVFPCFTFSRIHVSKQNSGTPHISHHIIQGFAWIFFAICWILRQHNSKAIKREKEQAKLISFLQCSCKTQDKTDQSGKIKRKLLCYRFVEYLYYIRHNNGVNFFNAFAKNNMIASKSYPSQGNSGICKKNIPFIILGI